MSCPGLLLIRYSFGFFKWKIYKNSLSWVSGFLFSGLVCITVLLCILITKWIIKTLIAFVIWN